MNTTHLRYFIVMQLLMNYLYCGLFDWLAKWGICDMYFKFTFKGTDSIDEKTVNLSFRRPQPIEPDWMYAYQKQNTSNSLVKKDSERFVFNH